MDDELELTDPQVAQAVARLMGALGSASRVRLLGRLRLGPCAVGELADALDMHQPAVSNQLRLLRDLGLVDFERQGRQIVYRLHDDHVDDLLVQAASHVEHLAFPRPLGAARQRGA